MEATPIDIGIFFVILFISFGIGMFCSWRTRNNQTLEENMLGSKSIKLAPLVLSVLATCINSQAGIAIPGHVFKYGMHMIWANIVVILLIPLTLKIFIPILYKLQVSSLYEYILMRFNNTTKLVASSIFIPCAMVNASGGLFLASLSLFYVTGWPTYAITLVTGTLVTIYTTLGGFRGVIWADAFQTIVILTGPFALVGKVLYDSGGGKNFASFDAKAFLFNTSADLTTEETIWNMMIGFLPFGLYYTCLSQMIIQRLMAAPDLKTAKRVYHVSIYILLFASVIFFPPGLLLYLYMKDCDPVRSGISNSYDEIVPYFMKTSMAEVPGLNGIYISGILCSGLSTISSHLNSYAVVTYVVLIKDRWTLSEKKAVIFTKVMTAVYGALVILIACFFHHLGTVLQFLIMVLSTYGGAIVGITILGMTCPWVNPAGAIAGFCTSVAFQCWIIIGNMMSHKDSGIQMETSLDACPPGMLNTTSMILQGNSTSTMIEAESAFYLYRVSAKWYGLITLIICLLVALIVSFLTGGLKQKVTDKRLYYTPMLNLWVKLNLITEPEEKIKQPEEYPMLSAEDDQKLKNYLAEMASGAEKKNGQEFMHVPTFKN